MRVMINALSSLHLFNGSSNNIQTAFDRGFQLRLKLRGSVIQNLRQLSFFRDCIEVQIEKTPLGVAWL